jgi:hypothetical protein
VHTIGVVEGFYGVPWSHGERLEFFDFAMETGFTTYLYAPKSDPFHRERWAEPYPAEQLASIGELAAAADARGIVFIYALSPGLTMRFTDDADQRAVSAKMQQLWDLGVRSFALLFDDLPYRLEWAEDRAEYGDGADGCGRAHGAACARFASDFLELHGIRGPLLMCPTDYAGTARSEYRDALRDSLPADSVVLWTGADVVVGTITRADVDAAAAAFERKLMLWDNFPVNDFDESRLFLGPLVGRPADLDGSALLGTLANPMPQAAASRIGLATVAEWAADPAAYDPSSAWSRAIDRVTNGSDGVAALVAACGAWPPGAPRSPALEEAIEGCLAGDARSLEAARALLLGLAETDARGLEPAFAASVEPWAAAARLTGAAGVRSVDLVAAGRVGERDATLRAEWDAVEALSQDVLRDTVRPLVLAALGEVDGREP